MRRLLPVLLLALPLSARAGLEGQVLPYRSVEVSAPVGSRLEALKVQEGEAVKAGQVLAQLYGRLEELEMQRAKALLERREYDAKGAKKLLENRIIPESKALEIRIDLELARLQYEAAAEQFRLRTIASPVDGLVVRSFREVGESVSTGQALFRVLDLSRLLVVCQVAPVQAAALRAGSPVLVRFDAPDAPGLPGTVQLVDPFAEAAGQVRVKVVVDNAEGRLRAGGRAWVEPAARP